MENQDYLKNFDDAISEENGKEYYLHVPPMEYEGGESTGFLDTLPAEDSFEFEASEESIDRSRRNLLKAAAVTAVIPTGLGTRLYGKQIIGETIGREEAERSLAEILTRLKDVYGMNVDFGKFGSEEAKRDIHGKEVMFLTEKREVCEAIEETLLFYPPSIYKKRASIRAIKIADDYGGDQEVSIAGQADKESGKVYLERHEGRKSSILLSLGGMFEDAAASSEDRKKKVRWELHHELLHMIDSVDENFWTKEARGLDFTERISVEALPSLYNYEIDILEQQSGLRPQVAKQCKKSLVGFVRAYGKTSGAEDRATIAEGLLIWPKKLEKLMTSDALLKRKVDFMKKEYFTMSRGVMNDGYWEVIGNHSDRPQMATEYVKLQSQFLLRLTPEQLHAYAAAKDIELSMDDMKSWREEITLGAGESRE